MPASAQSEGALLARSQRRAWNAITATNATIASVEAGVATARATPESWEIKSR